MAPANKKQQQPTYLHQHAADNLHFIRQSMEGSLTFTGVSGQGYVVTGLTALAAGWLAANQASDRLWLSVWLLELALAVSVMLTFTWHKYQKNADNLLRSVSGRKLLLAFLPTICAGAALSLLLLKLNLYNTLPAIWLIIYGAAVITAGAHSVKAIPFMGLAFFLLGVFAIFSKLSSDLLMGIGFGGIHIVWGIYIWNKHGG